MRRPAAVLLVLFTACGRASLAPRDLDKDGYPDAAELTTEDDRLAFVDSFVAVALAQTPIAEAAFDPSQRDCAGLVRYAYREALKRHDAAFAARHPGLPRLPDVRAFQYPDVPFLGTRLFRIRPGVFDPTEVKRDFAESAEAVRLAESSARRIDGLPRRGDLLLFRRPSGEHHLMIVASDERDPLLVYHTGPHEGGPGETRRVRLDALLSHPDPAWRPTLANESYLGAWRFRILEGT